MPTKDRVKANELAKERMRRYRERRNESVTPSEANESVTPKAVPGGPYPKTEETMLPSAPESPLEAINEELGGKGFPKLQKGVKIGHGLRFGKDRQVTRGLR